ncbi:MAG: site-2 protease family protein, partial [Candidatus Limnocylindria bacterium]
LSPAEIAGLVIGLLMGITLHEFSHALVADQLGDHRPRAMGRVSLNPLRHLDPLGTALLVLVGFGWGRPVLVNPSALRGGRNGMALVAVAGPVTNVLIAILLALVFRVLDIAGLDGTLATILGTAVFLNLLLAILNFIPIPPLDGFNVLLAFLPARWAYTVQRYAGWGIVLLVLLLVLPGGPLRWLFSLAQPLTRALLGT